MIYIFYCTLCDELDDEFFNYYLKSLPNSTQSQVLKFKKWDDRQRALFSKLLLVNGLNIIGINSYTIDEIKFTIYKRPYFDNDIDFNISHSGQYIVCGISFDHKIGIDIEEIKEIPLGDFKNEFSQKEMKAIMKADNSMSAFYALWTQKEAFLKAIGTGLFFPLNKIEIDNQKIKWNKQNWFLTEIILDDKYISHLCTDILQAEIIIQKINF